MKKKHLQLSELRVKSFVTEQDNTNANTVKGGTSRNPTPDTWCRICPAEF